MKRWVFLIVLLLSFSNMFAQKADLFTLKADEEGNVNISITNRSSGISGAELYRESGKGQPSIIFEFMQTGESFTEKAQPGTCYFLKIYSEDSTVTTTEKKCYYEEKYISRINFNMLAVLFIFIVSILIPFFFNGSFFNNRNSHYSSVIHKFMMMIDEGCRKVVLHAFSDSRHSILFYTTADFINTLHQKDSISIHSFYGCGSSDLMKDQRNSTDTFTIHASDGFLSSSYNDCLNPDNKKQISLSTTVSGIGMDSISGRKCLVSIEPFMISSQVSNEAKNFELKSSGAYTFLIMVSFMIIILSVLSTLSVFFPELKFFSGLTGGVK
ncbi:MAG TPA: hypothetical protein PKG52_03510 [bacterium]|nr:hypothetical protein [bacterium]HPS28914.1 hypothetical protein [bacterium]